MSSKTRNRAVSSISGNAEEAGLFLMELWGNSNRLLLLASLWRGRLYPARPLFEQFWSEFKQPLGT